MNTQSNYKTDAHTIAGAVDRLAFIKAQIAALQTEETALKQTLIKTAERLNPSRQLITAHTTQGEPVTSVRLYAHKTSN